MIEIRATPEDEALVRSLDDGAMTPKDRALVVARVRVFSRRAAIEECLEIALKCEGPSSSVYSDIHDLLDCETCFGTGRLMTPEGACLPVSAGKCPDCDGEETRLK